MARNESVENTSEVAAHRSGSAGHLFTKRALGSRSFFIARDFLGTLLGLALVNNVLEVLDVVKQNIDLFFFFGNFLLVFVSLFFQRFYCGFKSL